jgi:hypothetical protein
LVPARCSCTTAVRQLLAQAETAGVSLYLVALPGSNAAGLSRLVAAKAGKKGSTRVATDTEDVFTAAYQPIGLTVLLVDAHGVVTDTSQRGPNLEKQLRSLSRAR